nr:O-antigen ligase family protein [Limobrevibacterium gyesilva]
MHGRAVAEVLIGIIGLAFLLRCAALRDWSWLRHGWVKVGAAWWAWVIVCSLPGIGIGGTKSLLQALALGRFLVLVAALEHAVLAAPAARQWLQRVLTACSLYIAGQSLLQAATGRNLQGFPRYGEGELTGPFLHPRAAAPLSRLLFPTLLPPVARLLNNGIAAKLGAAALTIAGIGTIVLIGQRMPVLLTLLGLVVSGLMLRRLRALVATAILAGALLLAASVVVSPPTFYRLVTKFSAQMEDFPNSDYGLIGARAAFIALDHPIFGQGYDGFRNVCEDPHYFRAWSRSTDYAADGGGARICTIHPHNHYLEALTEAGFPGLLLFCALVVAWLRGLLRGIGRDPDPLRVGLFVAALIQEWPIASASSFTAIEIGGFFFLMLGYGLAIARAAPVRDTLQGRDAASSTAPISPSAGRPIT